MNIEKGILELKSEIIDVRRTIHKNPETGLKEVKTSEYIKNKLLEYGIDEIHNSAVTGIVGVLKGTEGKKTTAFRADIDGLPVKEENEVPYASTVDGWMHACGHDGHVAAILGLAKYAAQNRNKIKDNLVFIFQPAEEGPGGAEIMIKEGILETFEVDRIIGMHIFPEYPQGKVASKKGAIMARNGEIDITVRGKSAHGAMPQIGRDALVAAANVILALQTIVSRNIDPMQNAVLTLGKIEGGKAKNIIAGEVTIGGTLRAFNDDVYHCLVDRINEICDGIGKTYNCSVTVDFCHMYRVVNNDEELENALVRAVGDDFVESRSFMISEDFSFFQEKVPGLFYFLGAYNESCGYTNPLHSSRFNFDEDILLQAVQTDWNLLKELNALI